MPGLNHDDLKILGYYVEQNNRELYWNYLAQTPGNDGYALLALGVVRNDNAPGATANAFAANHARTHNGKALTEREWNDFGIDLIQQDFGLRQDHIAARRPNLALNMPVLDVRLAHDRTFDAVEIDANAWTPRQLLDAAHRQGGVAAAEEVWARMLDNRALGLWRGASTTYDMLARNDAELASGTYFADAALARTQAAVSRDHIDPDRIGADTFYYQYDRARGQWSQIETHNDLHPIRQVTEPALIQELNDTRALRLERETLRTQFHPDDPYRNLPLVKSPWLLAGNEAGTIDLAAKASSVPQATAPTPDQPGHACSALYRQCLEQVRALDAGLGRDFDQDSQRMAASLSRLALANDMTRVDHVMLSTPRAGAERNVFVVQGDPANPANHWASMPVSVATATPVETSFQQIDELQVARQAVQELAPALHQNESVRQPAAMRM